MTRSWRYAVALDSTEELVVQRAGTKGHPAMLPQRLPHFVVDAMNVIGSRPSGWWRDRDAAVRRLVERLDAIASADGCDVTWSSTAVLSTTCRKAFMAESGCYTPRALGEMLPTIASSNS